MRVLVAYGSKRGGTRGIAWELHDALVERGLDVDVASVDDVRVVGTYDAAVIGSSLYAMRWRPSVRRFVKRNAETLRAMPVWLFSSGPLDASATEKEIPAVRAAQDAAARIGARGHFTFGGRLAPDAKGFPAHAMAKKHAGDWRDHDQIHHVANDIADALLSAARPAGTDRP